VKRLGTYAEYSPSNTGIKLIGRARFRGKRHKGKRVEVYDRGRFFALTGFLVEGTPLTIADCQAEVDALVTVP